MVKPLGRLVLAFCLPLLAWLVLAAALDAPAVRAATLTVNTLTDENDGCGVGDCSLREAIAAANDGDTIDFGVSGTIDVSGNGQLVISKNMTISSSLPITISGNRAVRVFKVISSTATGTAVTFGGLTIAFGNDTSTDCFGTHSCGGGIYAGSGTAVTVTHSTVFSNTASRGGGLFADGPASGGGPANGPSKAAKVAGADLVIGDSRFDYNAAGLGGAAYILGPAKISGSTFTGNIAGFGSAVSWEHFSQGFDDRNPIFLHDNLFLSNTSAGGTVYNIGSPGTVKASASGTAAGRAAPMIISNSTFAGNTAANGAAIYNDGGSGPVAVSVINSTLISNSVTGKGGAIYNSGRFGGSARITVTQSSLISNTAGSGGAIYNDGKSGSANALVSGSTISGNQAADGAGLYNNGEGGVARASIVQSTLSNNTATGNGGGLLNQGLGGLAAATVSNSTLSGNSADGGGGIYHNGPPGNGILDMYNNTLSANAAGGGIGGGLYNNNNGTMHIRNTLIANSVGSSDCFSSNGPPITNLGTLIEDDSCSPAQSGDPKLGPLADNGGGTLTHALLTGSPAIDAGDNATCLSSDQRGTIRPQDGDDNGSSVCDIGAYEVPGVVGPRVYLPVILKP